MDLVGRLGYEYYSRANEAALFEVPKPRKSDAIGFDGLPKAIRESEYFSGNELARIASCPAVFSKPEIIEFLSTSEAKQMLREDLVKLSKAELSNFNFDKALFYAQCAYFAFE
jgi:hypothetical protein